MSLHVDVQDGAIVLVLPPHVPQSQGMAFARSKAEWLAGRMAALPPPIPFEDGVDLPLLGVAHRLRHDPLGRRGVWAEEGVIHVSGQAEHFARRLTDWLKRQAHAEIAGRAQPMAKQLGRPLGRISMRDTLTRWGSCTARGDLAFSWRLIFAPAEVLTYVTAHEVAHLAEMNHSPAFWRLVERLAPGSAPAKAWLKSKGTQLHRYGGS